MNKLIQKEKEEKIVNEIIKVVEEFYDTNLYLDTNLRKVARPRHIAVYLIKEYTKYISYEYLGKKFNRGHSNFSISVRKFKDSLPFDPQSKREIEELKFIIDNTCSSINYTLKLAMIRKTLKVLDTLNTEQVKEILINTKKLAEI